MLFHVIHLFTSYNEVLDVRRLIQRENNNISKIQAREYCLIHSAHPGDNPFVINLEILYNLTSRFHNASSDS